MRCLEDGAWEWRVGFSDGLCCYPSSLREGLGDVRWMMDWHGDSLEDVLGDGVAE